MDTAQSSPSPETDSISAMLRKAEMQTLQLQLEVRFKKNMAIFKEAARDIYDQFIDYQPKELRLMFTSEGYLNLVNYQLANKPVYESEPQEFIEKQVQDFLNRPAFSSVSFSKSKIMNDAHIHPPLINHLIDSYAPLSDTLRISSDKPIGLLIMTGCGLGYQIPALLKQTDIYNLCIFDPHKDSFYAALHCIDWGEIIGYFLRPGRMIKLFIGLEPSDAMSDLKLLTDRIGLHNIVYTFLYRHFGSSKEEAFINLYRKEFHLNASGTGFFDDEQVSFAHTLANLNRGTPLFLHNPKKDTPLPPLLLVGNGPSLDKHIEFLQRNRPNTIIFSCGTALSSLAKKGIKPDFHIEMERNIDVKDWLEVGTQPEDRQGVTLLCLNTCAPEVIALFDKACMAKKPNDCGEKIIEDALALLAPKYQGLKSLALCNPTVTNAGLSFAISMGFKEIYLVGVDLGMSAEGDHHSTLSPYHSLAKKTQLKDLSPLENTKTNYMIKGNFVEQVSTSLYLDSTRVNMQILLTYCERTLGDVRVYNSNDGAFIQGTKPIPLTDIQDFPPLPDKTAVIRQLNADHFIALPPQQLPEKTFCNQYLESFFALRSHLALPKQAPTREQLYHRLSHIYYYVRDQREKNPITTLLLRGSLQGYFTLLIKACLYQPNEQAYKAAYEIGRKAYMQFIKQCFEFMRTQPLKLDDTHDKNIIQARKILGDANL
jgi:hypothetical protein